RIRRKGGSLCPRISKKLVNKTPAERKRTAAIINGGQLSTPMRITKYVEPQMMYSANSALKSGNNCLKRIIPHGGNKKVQHSKRQNYLAGEIYNYVLMLKIC
ncbi:hypothetical protein PDM95_27130, partial [Bacillus cereus]|nr:hypothetical protein [Bacillus cereus]